MWINANDWKSQSGDKKLLRGGHWPSAEKVVSIASPINRTPVNMPIDVHHRIDDFFESHFGIRFRSRSLFTTGSRTVAGSYGQIRRIVPTQDFCFCWSPLAVDLFEEVLHRSSEESYEDLLSRLSYRCDDLHGHRQRKRDHAGRGRIRCLPPGVRVMIASSADGLELLRRLGVNVLDGRYEAQSPLGSSFGGAAFKGVDRQGDRPVFMKYLICARGEHERSKFLLERDALSQIERWPMRVAPRLLFDQEFQDVSVHALVLEWIDGETLTRFLGRAQQLSLEERLEAFHRIIVAASGATLQFQHRDVHPGNILLLPRETMRMGPGVEQFDIDPGVRLLDWGEALPHLFGNYDEEPDHHFVLLKQAPTTVSGSFTSLPPEVFEPWQAGTGLGGTYESWGFGLLLYSMLTGNKPVQHRGLGEYIEAIRTGSLSAWIEGAYEEIRILGLPGGSLLPELLRQMLRLAPARRATLAMAARILWDVRYEGLELNAGSALTQYWSDPHRYEPQGGWRFSSVPDYD